jgi:tRNA wybutosine-synthesizing protein 4
MLAHFEKLHTPLRAVVKYPTTTDQEGRFRAAGWGNVWARNLWELWRSTDFLTSAQRMALDDIEPFDEWEEFALFASHYFLLTASNGNQPATPTSELSRQKLTRSLNPKAITVRMNFAEYPKSNGHRRYGDSLPVRGRNRKHDLIGNFGGIGLKSRLNSYDTYTPSSVPVQLFYNYPLSQGPSARMCHTITDLRDAGALLVGGRMSPDSGLADCWLYHKWTNAWERVDDLPEVRYRHSAVVVGGDSVLVVGGKSDSRTISKDFLIWHRRRGWISCDVRWRVHNDEQPAIFGGMLGSIDTESPSSDTVVGILAGGMSQDGVISEAVWFWTLNRYNDDVRSNLFSFGSRDATLLTFTL